MGSLRSILIQICLITTYLHICTALYEDQAGKLDWKRSFIGKAKQAQFSQLDNKQRLIVFTEENVLACISPKTSHILWRQILEDPADHQPQLLDIDNQHITTVSGSTNSFYIRTWDLPTGSLINEWTIYNEQPVDTIWAINQFRLAQITLVPGSRLEITIYNPRMGENSEKSTKITADWVRSSDQCALAKNYLACVHNGRVFWFDLFQETPKINSKAIEQTGESANLLEFEAQTPSFLLVQNGKARILEIRGDSIEEKPFSLISNAVCVGNSVFQLEANVANPDKLIRVKSINLDSGKEDLSVDIEYPLGLGAPYIVTGQCKNSNCELLLSSTDQALTLVKLPEGKVVWTREEALSNIVAVEFLELPISELDASIENEFKTATGDVISMLTHRISTQSKQLYNFIFGGQLLSNNGLVRDDFGLHKIIVVATKIGKLFAIDTLTGSIVWSYRLPHVEAFADGTMRLLVQRTAGHAPLSAQCLLLARDSSTSAGVLFRFDPITGVSKRGIERLSYKIKQTLLLPHEDELHFKPAIVIASDGSHHVYPEGSRISKRHTFIYSVDANILRGYKMSDKGVDQVWEVNFGPGELAAVSTRPVSERVHSQGRVLPDRSVYYKFVNPNLIAVATLNSDLIHRHVLNVYLIDGVTGLVLYSTSHKKAKGPVHLIHSENWLVYTFFNERFRRFEVVAAEMYEGQFQSNSTAFSSFAIGQLPQVHSQSYILPATPVSMAVTLTERGITNKFLLVGLSTGAVTEIPWILLQPRFDGHVCGPEESCIPYMPEVPLPAEATINYNQTLERIKGIQVAPARLESTSHVLVYGLDLFYTRVAPSKTFDVLKEDFDHRLIVLVLVALIAASYGSKYLAARKALRQAWK